MPSLDDGLRSLLRGGAWIATGVLVLSVIGAGWAFEQDARHTQAIDGDRDLIVAFERVLSALKDVETGERGFIITGHDSYLEPYNWGTSAVHQDEERLSALIGSEVDKLSGLIAARLKEAADGIATFRRDGPAAGAASIDTGLGKSLMDQVRVEVARLQQEANQRVADVMSEKRLDDGLRIGSVVGLVLSSLVLAALAFVRKRERQASERLFEGVLENAPVGLGILDRSLRIRHVNPALARMSERALSAAPGMSIWDVVPQLRDTLEDRLDRVLRGGRAANTEVEAVSNKHADQIRSYEVSFYPLQAARSRNADSEGVGMVIADVTARKRAERAVHDSEARFRSLVEANTAMIWTTDAEGAFVKPQPAWMGFTGQSEAEASGWGRLTCIHPEDRARTAEAWRIGKATGQPIKLENRLRRHDGAWRHMAVSVVPVREEAGTVREWVGSHADITERKEAEQALGEAKEAAESANRAKSAFLANMSHELRTPLSAVIGYSEMLEEEADETGQTTMLTDLGKIKSNAKHLLSLINDVLDLSKVEANKMDVYVETVDVATFVRDATETVAALVARKANELVLDIELDVGSMRTDTVKLRQCLFNLLSNAAKFTEAGTVTLAVRRAHDPGGDTLAFSVRDTGIGMTPDQLARLFQRFTQADESTTRKFGGTGLGLALSRAFAQLLGGDVEVESREGAGTTFTVRILAELPEADLGAEQVEPLQAPSMSKGAVVLVIDDEASQRELMTRFLERQGFAVRVAANGEVGIDLARELQPRVVLLDIMMPGLDGWTVLGRLKADPVTASIPVIMVSFVADASMSVSLGASDSLPKPVDWTRLKTIMDRYRQEGGDVLVIDDDAEARARLRAVLQKHGWTVSEAENGAVALNKVAKTAPHMILLDLTMPVMDGFAFLHRLRDMPGGADIPVLVLTARDISGSERAQLVEADGILRKGEASFREISDELRRLEQGRDASQ